MANTSSRTLRLLSLLQTHRFWPGGELADRLEVSERTLRRDVDRLRELGYPVHATRGAAGGYQLGSGASMPPLVVDEDEAIALVVALGGSSSSGQLGEATLSALSKVMQVLPARLRRRAEALRAVTVDSPWSTAPEVDATVLAVLAQATRDAERVRFGYTARGGLAPGAEVRRHVEPHHLVTIGNRWYLAAYDLERQDWRSFRLDRMSDPAGTRARFRPREVPGGDAAAYVRSGITGRDRQDSESVTALVALPAEDCARRIGRHGTVTEVDADSCRLVVEARGAWWVAFALGAVGAAFTIEEATPGVRATLGDWGSRFGAAVAS